VTQPPGGLVDSQRRARSLRLVDRADWYLVKKGSFELLGTGDVSEADLGSVHRELRASGVFVCVAKPPPLERYLGKQPWGVRRLSFSSRVNSPAGPKLRWVALGARLAVLPDLGAVWVDDEHLFPAGEQVPLPWTNPPVALIVVRPRTLYAAMKAMIGPGGPKRASPPATDRG
jgi:hypothetical protein